jgi:hypothetical protein
LSLKTGATDRGSAETDLEMGRASQVPEHRKTSCDLVQPEPVIIRSNGDGIVKDRTYQKWYSLSEPQ